MGGGSAFQYAVVRIVPRVERGERMNAGVVLLCAPLRFLGARVHLDERRLLALDPSADPALLSARLREIERIAAGDAAAGPIARLDRTQRFHWLAAPSSTVVQPSAVHTGLCEDADAMLEHLFARLVLPHDGG